MLPLSMANVMALTKLPLIQLLLNFIPITLLQHLLLLHGNFKLFSKKILNRQTVLTESLMLISLLSFMKTFSIPPLMVLLMFVILKVNWNGMVKPIMDLNALTLDLVLSMEAPLSSRI